MGSVLKNAGFTLIELMITAAIVAILAMIAIPKFGALVLRAKEAAIKGQLGSLRSALSLYYANNEGIAPSPVGNWPSLPTRVLQRTLVPTYLDRIPNSQLPQHSTIGNANEITFLILPLSASDIPLLGFGACGPDLDMMPWIYCPFEPTILVQCDHTDSRGSRWSAY